MEDKLAALRHELSVSNSVMDRIINFVNWVLSSSAMALGVHSNDVSDGVGVPTLGLTARRLRREERMAFDTLVCACVPTRGWGLIAHRVHSAWRFLNALCRLDRAFSLLRR